MTHQPGRQGARPGDVGDLPMTELDHVAYRQAYAARLVVAHRRDVRVVDPPVDRHDGYAFLDRARDRRILALRAGQDQPVDAARPQRVDQHRFAFRIAVRVRDHRDVAPRGQGVLDAAEDRWEDRVGDVRHDHADRHRAACAQARGDRVRAIAALAGGADDPLRDLGGDQMPGPGVEGAGHGRRVHADSIGDVLERGPALAHAGSLSYSLDDPQTFAYAPSVRNREGVPMAANAHRLGWIGMGRMGYPMAERL